MDNKEGLLSPSLCRPIQGTNIFINRLQIPFLELVGCIYLLSAPIRWSKMESFVEIRQITLLITLDVLPDDDFDSDNTVAAIVDSLTRAGYYVQSNVHLSDKVKRLSGVVKDDIVKEIVGKLEQWIKMPMTQLRVMSVASSPCQPILKIEVMYGSSPNVAREPGHRSTPRLK